MPMLWLHSLFRRLSHSPRTSLKHGVRLNPRGLPERCCCPVLWHICPRIAVASLREKRGTKTRHMQTVHTRLGTGLRVDGEHTPDPSVHGAIYPRPHGARGAGSSRGSYNGYIFLGC